jgi:hypothetical protein
MSKRKLIGAVLGFVLAVAVGAVAATILWNNHFVQGTGPNGTISQVQTNMPSFTVTNKGATVPASLDPGGSITIPFTVTNTGTDPQTVPSGLTATITSVPADCASHITVGNVAASPFNSSAGSNLEDQATWKAGGRTYTAGQAFDSPPGLGIHVSADASLPTDCTNGDATFKVVIGG